jgi:hypothetical protein
VYFESNSPLKSVLLFIMLFRGFMKVFVAKLADWLYMTIHTYVIKSSSRSISNFIDILPIFIGTLFEKLRSI